jgi:hypothetical protein
LVSFYDEIKNTKSILLLGSSFVNANNGSEMCKALENVLDNYKQWPDVIAL